MHLSLKFYLELTSFVFFFFSRSNTIVAEKVLYGVTKSALKQGFRVEFGFKVKVWGWHSSLGLGQVCQNRVVPRRIAAYSMDAAPNLLCFEEFFATRIFCIIYRYAL